MSNCTKSNELMIQKGFICNLAFKVNMLTLVLVVVFLEVGAS